MPEPVADPEVEATVRTLLRVAGLQPSEKEIAQLVQMYPGIRDAAGKLYFDAVRYEEPALIYEAKLS